MQFLSLWIYEDCCSLRYHKILFHVLTEYQASSCINFRRRKFILYSYSHTTYITHHRLASLLELEQEQGTQLNKYTVVRYTYMYCLLDNKYVYTLSDLRKYIINTVGFSFLLLSSILWFLRAKRELLSFILFIIKNKKIINYYCLEAEFFVLVLFYW